MKNAIRLRWTEKTCMGGYSSFRSFSNAEIDFNVTKFHKSWNCEKLSPKESNLHTAAVCRVSKHFGENDTGQRKLRWNKEVWQQETNSVFFVVSEKKKSILGRYINTLFFYYKRHKWFPHFKNVMLMFFFSFAVKIYLIHDVKFVSMPVYRNSCVSCYIWDRTRTCWNKPS